MTFSEYKTNITQNNASNQYVSPTPGDQVENYKERIFWKMIYSNSGYEKSIANYPDTNDILDNLYNLAEIMKALATSIGMTLHINSGYRNNAVNTLVKGSTTSQHCKGQALDLDCSQNSKLFIYILNSEKWKNRFDQLIWEDNGAWVHCSFASPPRGYNGTKVYWKQKGSDSYTDIWNSKYKKTTNDGTVYFEGVTGLSGVKFDSSWEHDADMSKIGAMKTVGSASYTNNANSNSVTGQSYQPAGKNYGGSSYYGANNVKRLSSAKRFGNKNEPKVNDNRKRDFETLMNRLVDEAPGLQREILTSAEMYEPSILKGDQVSKERVK